MREGTVPSYKVLIPYMRVEYSEFSDVFEKPGTPPERFIKLEIDLLPESVPLANR